MSDDDSEERQTLWDLAEEIAALAVTGTWLAAMFVGYENWLAIMLFGYIFVVGGISVIADHMKSRQYARDHWGEDDEEDPVERLQRRYVDGEIDEAEYERRLDTIMSTDAERRSAPTTTDLDRRREREPE